MMTFFRSILLPAFGFSLLTAAAQKNASGAADGPPMIRYNYDLRFDIPAALSATPYYARFTGPVARAKASDHPLPPLAMDQAAAEHWFEYAPPRVALYADGFLVGEQGSRGDDINLKASLNCSKLLNSKGEEVYIYTVMRIGQDSLERMNPWLAFDGMNYINPVTYWKPAAFVNEPFTTIHADDLPKGTYYFNWWDSTDVLNKEIRGLWKTIAFYEARLDAVRDRMNGKTQKQTDLPDTVTFTSVEDQYEQEVHAAYDRVILAGYGDPKAMGSGWPIRFDIRKKALLLHKISDTPVPPSEVNACITAPERKRSAVVKKLLETF